LGMVDSHEHLPSEGERISRPQDPFSIFLSHHINSDLISSGMSPEALERVMDPAAPLDGRWRILSPYWARVENTSHAAVLKVAARDLYGVGDLGPGGWAGLRDGMKASATEGFYERVLDRAGIRSVILDVPPHDRGPDPGYGPRFKKVVRFDELVMVSDRRGLEALGDGMGMRIHSLPDLLDCLDRRFEEASEWAVGAKIWLAFRRPMLFEKVSASEAEEAFNLIFKTRAFRRETIGGLRTTVPEGPSIEALRPMQDYLIHRILGLAEARGLPVQIHTGHQEGNENALSNSNPLQLIDLLREYRDLKFCLLHCGYPFLGETVSLCKSFPNAYADLSWLYAFSQSASATALSWLLSAIPRNKIIGFGGDYRFIEGTYGHSILARECVSRVLSRFVDEGSMALDEAVETARMILSENALEVFGLRRGDG